MRYSGTLASSAAMSAMIGALADLTARGHHHHYGRTRHIGGYRGPRSKYRPHQGAQEIARRQRQAARLAARAGQ